MKKTNLNFKPIQNPDVIKHTENCNNLH